jgi:hypothetical protein
MTGALILFFIVMIAYMLIAEIFTVLFRLTGLPEAKARLQVVSLLTTCGFTTKETEVFVTTPTRRKLAIAAMIFGYAFSATLVSAFISIILSIGNSQDENLWHVFLILLLVMVFFIILSKIKFIKNAFDSLIFKIGHKLSKIKTKNFLKVVDAYDANSIVEITLVDIPNNFKNKTLEEIKIRQNYNLTVLAINRENKIINNIKKEDFFKEKDIVTVYGNFDDIKKVFIEDVEKQIKELEKTEKVEK